MRRLLLEASPGGRNFKGRRVLAFLQAKRKLNPLSWLFSSCHCQFQISQIENIYFIKVITYNHAFSWEFGCIYWLPSLSIIKYNSACMYPSHSVPCVELMDRDENPADDCLMIGLAEYLATIAVWAGHVHTMAHTWRRIFSSTHTLRPG